MGTRLIEARLSLPRARTRLIEARLSLPHDRNSSAREGRESGRKGPADD